MQCRMARAGLAGTERAGSSLLRQWVAAAEATVGCHLALQCSMATAGLAGTEGPGRSLPRQWVAVAAATVGCHRVEVARGGAALLGCMAEVRAPRMMAQGRTRCWQSRTHPVEGEARILVGRGPKPWWRGRPGTWGGGGSTSRCKRTSCRSVSARSHVTFAAGQHWHIGQ